MTLLTQIVNDLSKVNREILHKSQMKYNATDRILYNIDQMSLLIRHKETKIMITDNFAMGLFSLNGTTINGIKVSMCYSKICDIASIQNASLTDFQSIREVDAVFILSEKLLENIIRNKNITKLVVTVFLRNSLFNEEHRQISTSLIFGIQLKGKFYSHHV